MYTDIICTIPVGKKSVVLAWLLAQGVDVNRDEDGIAITKNEKVIGSVCTPIARDVLTNALFFRIRFKDNIATQIPEKPNYIVWRSDDLVDGELKPEPTYTVNTYAEDGATVTGTRQQLVGGF